jgi:hypothetical protein
MNAFEAAGKNDRADDLQKQLEVLFNSQNKSLSKDATTIPATFLSVAVARGADHSIPRDGHALGKAQAQSGIYYAADSAAAPVVSVLILRA